MRLVLLGDPVEHSLSPAIHQAAMQALEIPGRYTARRVDATGVEHAFGELRGGLLEGANVTMPHKRLASDLCDALSGQAARSRAVNTLVAEDGQVEGHNTDVDGVRFAWTEAGLPQQGPVLVLGAGGAAAAALLALEGRPLLVAARRREAAAALLDGVGVEGTVVPWGRPCPGAVVVNATPLGIQGEALPQAVVKAAAGLLDMAYGPRRTPAIALATNIDLPVADGLEMLLGQAMASFVLWTGHPAPEEAMRAALRRGPPQPSP